MWGSMTQSTILTAKRKGRLIKDNSDKACSAACTSGEP
jgi:hypothetical protein